MKQQLAFKAVWPERKGMKGGVNATKMWFLLQRPVDILTWPGEVILKLFLVRCDIFNPTYIEYVTGFSLPGLPRTMSNAP